MTDNPQPEDTRPGEPGPAAPAADGPVVLVVQPDGTAWTQRIGLDESRQLEAMQALVGGWIEGVQGDGFTVICNEEGKLEGLPPNPLATQVTRDRTFFADTLVGTVLFCSTKPDGATGGVPISIEQAVAALISGEVERRHAEH